MKSDRELLELAESALRKQFPPNTGMHHALFDGDVLTTAGRFTITTILDSRQENVAADSYWHIAELMKTPEGASVIEHVTALLASNALGIQARMRAAGMYGLLSEILGSGAFRNHYGSDPDLIERIKMACADQESVMAGAGALGDGGSGT